MRLLIIASFLIATFTAAIPTSAYAWSQFGHVLVCEIAYRQMSEEAREKLNVLIDNQGFRDVHDEPRYPSFNHGCLREDQVRNRPKEHYINYPRNWAVVDDGDCPGWNDCLLSAIEKDKALLADTSATNDDRLAAALALGHWIGDIHQPLHVSFSDDRGGNSIKKRGACRARNLHAVWDRCLVERRVIFVTQPDNPEDFAEFTPMYRAADRLIQDANAADVLAWQVDPAWQWAAESFELVRSDELKYCVQDGDTCKYTASESHHDGDENNQKQIRINKDYLDRFGPVVTERLTQAGYRLAAALDEALGS